MNVWSFLFIIASCMPVCDGDEGASEFSPVHDMCGQRPPTSRPQNRTRTLTALFVPIPLLGFPLLFSSFCFFFQDNCGFTFFNHYLAWLSRFAFNLYIHTCRHTSYFFFLFTATTPHSASSKTFVLAGPFFFFPPPFSVAAAAAPHSHSPPSSHLPLRLMPLY